MDQMRINVDGSAWSKHPMSFILEPSQASDQELLTGVCNSIFQMVKGEVEFTGTEKPCTLHRANVWREIDFSFDDDGKLIGDVYVCCRDYGGRIAPSIPQIEAFVKRKLKLPA